MKGKTESGVCAALRRACLEVQAELLRRGALVRERSAGQERGRMRALAAYLELQILVPRLCCADALLQRSKERAATGAPSVSQVRGSSAAGCRSGWRTCMRACVRAQNWVNLGC